MLAANGMEEIAVSLAQQLSEKHYGKYRGFVVDNKDPERRGRLKLRVPSVLGEQASDWALPCLPFGGLKDQGLFLVPETNAQVWAEFEEGDVNRPIWTGVFWQQQADTPAEAALKKPTTRILKTKAGHVLQFDDEEKKEKFRLHHPKNAELTISEKGTIALTDAKGNTLTLDADAGKIVLRDANGNTLTMDSSGTALVDSNGHRIEMAASGINVKGQKIVVQGTQIMLGSEGGEPVIKGQSFLSLFASHVHPHTLGPTGPPVPQGEMSSLSVKVTSA